MRATDAPNKWLRRTELSVLRHWLSLLKGPLTVGVGLMTVHLDGVGDAVCVAIHSLSDQGGNT